MMNVSKEDAGQALDIVDEAGARIVTLRRYARVAPLLFVWGSVWIVANVVTDLAPQWSNTAWLVGGTLGAALSAVIALARIRKPGSPFPEGSARRREARRRFAMLALTICCFFPTMFSVLGPLAARQENAFISLCWAFLYMFAGAWLGWRLFAIGVIAVAATSVGYLAITEHYYLWMACCGGGSLIAGGVWLRTI